MHTSIFDKLIWRTIGPKSFLIAFGTAQFSLCASGAVNYDYIVTNSINSLLIGSRCIPNGAHTLAIFEPIWPILQNVLKTVMHTYNIYIYNSHIIYMYNLYIHVHNTQHTYTFMYTYVHIWMHTYNIYYYIHLCMYIVQY